MKTEKEIRKELAEFRRLKRRVIQLGGSPWYPSGLIASLEWVLENEKAKAKVKK